MKKIIHYSNFSINSFGGIERVVRKSIAIAAAAGIKSVNICLKKKGVRSSRWDNSFSSILTIKKNPISIRYILSALDRVKAEDLVIVHYPNFNAMLAGLIASYRTSNLILFAHSSASHHGKIVSIGYRAILYFYKKYPVVWTSSKKLGEYFKVNGELRNIDDVIPLCIVPKIKNSIPSKAVGELVGSKKRYFLYIGRDSGYKNLDTIVDELNLRDISAIVCFTNRSPSAICSGEGTVSVLEGGLSEADKSYLICNAFYLLFPSNAVGEGFGLIQLEAIRFGVPIVNLNLPTGVTEVGRHLKSAITLDLECSMNKYASFVDCLSKRPRLREKMSARALAWYDENYSLDDAIDRLNSLSRFWVKS